jgi:ribose-phosphate pyrophosphokinase
MIILQNLNTKTECIVKADIFPDGTSQVWKLPDDVLNQGLSEYKVIWWFENEGEIMHLLQLRKLVKINELIVPYFPYARQDKKISNNETFARDCFLNFIHQMILPIGWSGEKKVQVFDLHSPSLWVTPVVNPAKFIAEAFFDANSNIICYPDIGAKNRYQSNFQLNKCIVAEKTRNQSTGNIEGHKLLDSDINLVDKNVLIVDDICDGGATFISVAKMLKSAGAANIDLYVSHGIFSKGVHLLTELGGIRNIYTTDSYLPSQAKLKNHSNVKVFKLEL